MKKLYKVKLQTLGIYNTSYVIAEHPTEAYEKVIKFLNDNDLTFKNERTLDSIELIAESKEYFNTKCRLYL